MTTFAFPTLTRPPSTTGLRVLANTAVYRSPLNGAVQVLQRPGTRLMMVLTYQFMEGADRAELIGFLAGLYGQEHLVTASDPAHVQRGALGGTPLVNGASQVGEALIVDGGPSSQTNWLRRGDQISYNNGTFDELKIVTADVNTDGPGNATIPISPSIHTSPANNAAVDIVVPMIGTWRLAAADSANWMVRPPILSTFNIPLEEHIA